VVEPPAPLPPIVTQPPARAWWASRPMIACGTGGVVIALGLILWRAHEAKAITVDAKSPSPAAGGIVGALPMGDLRMIAGSANPYFDRSGRSWTPDRFFTGGNVLVRPAERVLRTLDPDIYRHARSGD